MKNNFAEQQDPPKDKSNKATQAVYDLQDIEFIGAKKDTKGKFFGTCDKEFFIFKIRQSLAANGGGEDNTEAYLVIASK